MCRSDSVVSTSCCLKFTFNSRCNFRLCLELFYVSESNMSDFQAILKNYATIRGLSQRTIYIKNSPLTYRSSTISELDAFSPTAKTFYLIDLTICSRFCASPLLREFCTFTTVYIIYFHKLIYALS